MSLDALDRLQRIEAQVRLAGKAKVADLAAELDVSEMTIRRDLDVLAEQGVVRRIRGGAVSVGPQPFAERFGRQIRAKDRIAAKLEPLVGDGGAIGVDASSTLQRLAVRLAVHPGEVRDLTVVTNGPDTFGTLQDEPGVTALLTGGQLDPRTGSLVGPLATRAARELLLRRLFVSAAAVHPHHGTSETTLEDAEVKLALADVAAEVVVAVDSGKLDQRAAARCLRPERVAILVTELDPADSRLDPYRERWEVR
jgi:DeoR family fructose operon transcriptional repressor